MENDSSESKTAISLPKGGGAVKGIGETFQPNLFTGTGNFSIPIATSPGRNGFGPELTLQYSSGNGNSPFGLGWQLSIPRITRKTEKGLPTYTNQDVFVMSGAEDLVQALDENGNPISVPDLAGYAIKRYRPRTEGLFARIERWQRTDDPNDVHWRVTTKENVTSIYGKSPSARLVEPDHPAHIFEWLLEETVDAKGNHILYEYVQEDPDLTLPGIHERNRRYTQAYIRRILYGNTPDNLDTDKKAGPERIASHHVDPMLHKTRHYLFEVLFDYGELPNALPIYDESNSDAPWWGPSNDNLSTVEPRKDPFSTFRSGFEIRTLRLCSRILMLHHFKEGELIGAPLVKSTNFTYIQDPHAGFSVLQEVTVWGYRKDPHDAARYLARDMPPVTFGYSEFEPKKQRYQSVTVEGGDLPPLALNNPSTTLMDIFGDGIPDVVQSTTNGFYYWENRGGARLGRRRHPEHHTPAGVTLDQANVAVGDLGGDGLADLMVEAPPISGFYEATPDGGWKPFKRIESMPTIDFSDPDVRLVDLTGDGLSDMLITRDTHFLWFRSRGEAGYENPQRLPRQHDLDAFPDVYFSDPAGRVRLADMSGDGLNDIVLVHDGRIDYWPNLGYGQWGKRITMGDTPRIGYGFDPRRLFLADLDGTGCADLVYVDFNQVHFWFNRSANNWSEKHTIRGTPYTADTTGLQFADFYGTGTACLVWSYDYGSITGGNYKVLDFCGSKKPHLLVEMSNNMGATTRAQYASSTKFYLEEKTNGQPWLTNLPFPVQVLEKSEVIDHISKTKLVTTYKYHHGYYDGREREFRGFGRVDQFDTEFFDDFVGSNLHEGQDLFANNNEGFHVPPVETRTWYHTGIYFDPDRYLDHRELTQQYEREYYHEDPAAFELGEHAVQQADGAKGHGPLPHEAFRALRGAVLRSEVYARDDTDKADHPYTVTENRYVIKELQAQHSNPHAIFLTTPKESLTYHYERNPDDPRVGHTLTLAVDDYGNVTESVAIGYPRRQVPADLSEQGELKAVYSRTDFINKDVPGAGRTLGYYYAGIPCQTRSYEVTGLDWQTGDEHLKEWVFEGVRDGSMDVDPGTFKPYEWERSSGQTGIHRRIIEWSRNYFRNDEQPDDIDTIGNLQHRLQLGEIDGLGLPYESYQAVFTEELLQKIYEGRQTGSSLAEEGGYHPHANYPDAEGSVVQDFWWVPSGRQAFDLDKFFLPIKAQDPFNNISATEFDDYALLLIRAKDALPDPQTNIIQAKNDYRVLQPYEIIDPNHNRSQVAFNAFGLVVGTAVMGVDEQDNIVVGDDLIGFKSDLDEAVINDHLSDPIGNDPRAILVNATTRLIYDFKRYSDHGEPNLVYTMARETHSKDELGTPSKIQHSFAYADGFGREIQTKIQAEPGLVDGVLVENRWVGTGWKIFNNKGKPVKQYEPFFDNTHNFRFGKKVGVSSTLFYDPLERVVATLHPNNTYEKVVFNPWRQETWDVNDTIHPTQRHDPQTGNLPDPGFRPTDDPDVGHYFVRLPEGEYWPTWYQRRMDAVERLAAWPDQDEEGNPLPHNQQVRAAEEEAAKKAAKHAATPTQAHFDTLGRTFLTLVDNGKDKDGVDQFFETRTELDIEGNTLRIIDARGNAVMDYRVAIDEGGTKRFITGYDIAGRQLYQNSMDAGERRVLMNVTGNPIRAWDSRGHIVTTRYDALQRPTHLYVQPGDDVYRDQDRYPKRAHLYLQRLPEPGYLAERTVYGDGRNSGLTEAQVRAANLRGEVYQQFDGAGVLTFRQYDFKGNLLRSERQLLVDYRTQVDWSGTPALEGEIFTSRTRYDALNRSIQVLTPHNAQIPPNVTQFIYNEANLLEREEVWLRRNAVPAGLLDPTLEKPDQWPVTNIDYNARGQRIRIAYGNGAVTVYTYDKHTFRLVHLHTVRPHPDTDKRDVQDLRYTYDPAGNITAIRDEAQQKVFFANTVVEPHCAYTYDALYRLIRAEGREHAVQNNIQRDAKGFKPEIGIPFPNSPDALQTYTEEYSYDGVGNIEEMRHQGGGVQRWNRYYRYTEESNRLLETSQPGDDRDDTHYSSPYDYNAHGSMTSMPHLPLMVLDFEEQLRASSKQVRTDGGTPEITYYVYDAAGQRVRKVTERQADPGKTPRRMKERLYLE